MTNWKPIALGLGIAGAAGAILYSTTRKKVPPQNIGIHYVSEADLASAQYAQKELNATLIRSDNLGEGGTVEQSLAEISAFDMVISIGAQLTNPIYEYAVSQGIVRPIEAAGDIIAKEIVISGQRIILAAGATAADTSNAVVQAISMVR